MRKKRLLVIIIALTVLVAVGLTSAFCVESGKVKSAPVVSTGCGSGATGCGAPSTATTGSKTSACGCGSATSGCGVAPGTPAATVSKTSAGGCGTASSGCGSATNGNVSQQPTAGAINLTDEQKRQLAEIDSKYNSHLVELRANFQNMRNELNQLVADKNADDEMIAQKVHEVADAQAEFQLATILSRREKDKVYTPEQRGMVAKTDNAGGCGGGNRGAVQAGGCGSSGSCGAAATGK